MSMANKYLYKSMFRRFCEHWFFW